ncbi:hypothetical protein BDQ17DRAFT_1508648 [Cyathus striatus]|nr:hypothetical protein BDQ17DRAFT_1508648 [Cyathus striatus]
MSMNIIPTEIIDSIIDDLGEDVNTDENRDALVALSQVSQKFTQRSQKYLFLRFVFMIELTEVPRLTGLINMFEQKGIGNYVQEIFFIGNEFQFPDEFIPVWCTIYPLMLQLLQNTPNLTSFNVRIAHQEFWPLYFCEVLRHVPKQILSICPNITKMYFGNFFTSLPEPLPKLSLDYLICNGSDGVLKSFAANSEGNDTLKDLRVILTHNESIPAAWTLVANSASTLEHFKIDVSTYGASLTLLNYTDESEEPEDVNVFDVAPLQTALSSLERLEIAIPWLNLETCCGFLERHISKANALQSFRLYVDCYMDEEPQSLLTALHNHWLNLNSIVCSWNNGCVVEIGLRKEGESERGKYWEKYKVPLLIPEMEYLTFYETGEYVYSESDSEDYETNSELDSDSEDYETDSEMEDKEENTPE